MKNKSESKEQRGITMSQHIFNNDRVRRLIQSDHNLQDSNNEDNWIAGTTVKGRAYIQITLQSGDKLRIYNELERGSHPIQFAVNDKWARVFDGADTIQESKDIVLHIYTKR